MIAIGIEGEGVSPRGVIGSLMREPRCSEAAHDFGRRLNTVEQHWCSHRKRFKNGYSIALRTNTEEDVGSSHVLQHIRIGCLLNPLNTDP